MIQKSDWKTVEAPHLKRKVEISRILPDDEYERLIKGHKPTDMDDKWFVYSENGWVYFHRSWPGHLIFWIKLDGCPVGVRITNAYANDKKDQYSSAGPDSDIEIINSLIDQYIHSQ